MEVIDVFHDSGNHGLDYSLAFFASGECGVAPSTCWRIGAFTVGTAGEGAGLIGIEIAGRSVHANGFGSDEKHH